MKIGQIPLLAGACALMVLAGCATTTPQAELSDEEAVEMRAQARWDHLVARTFDQAYDYYTPGFREVGRRERFAADMQGRPIRWHDAQVVSVDCEENQCAVKTRVSYQAIAAPSGQSQMRMTRDLDERWIRIDGQWWYVTN